MGHTPYGYRIEDGKAVVDEKTSEQVKELFSGYLAGLSLKEAAKKAGIDCYHATVSRMLQNKQYLGDEFYPSIIDEEIFEKVMEQAENFKKNILDDSNVSSINKKFKSTTSIKYSLRSNIENDNLKVAETNANAEEEK